jgi:hypothetical protein
MKTCGELRYSSTILNLSTRRVVSFTRRLFYTWEKSTRYRVHRRMSGPQSRGGCSGEDPSWESNPSSSAVQPVARCYTDWATSLWTRGLQWWTAGWLLNDKLKIIWKQSWLNWGTIVATVWRNWGKPRQPSHDSRSVRRFSSCSTRTDGANFTFRITNTTKMQFKPPFSWLQQGRGNCSGKRLSFSRRMAAGWNLYWASDVVARSGLNELLEPGRHVKFYKFCAKTVLSLTIRNAARV